MMRPFISPAALLVKVMARMPRKRRRSCWRKASVPRSHRGASVLMASFRYSFTKVKVLPLPAAALHITNGFSVFCAFPIGIVFDCKYTIFFQLLSNLNVP